MINQIKELSEEEIKNYKKLGTAFGIFEVCLFMAHKHVPNFENRVAGYRITEEGSAKIVNDAFVSAGLDIEKCINVTFYEK